MAISRINQWLVRIKKLTSLKSRVFKVVMHIACKRVALADEQRRGFLLLESGILFNCKDRVKDCLKLPSYDLMRARSPECNTAWILDPASSKHLSSKRDTGVDQNGMSSRNLTNPYTNPH